MIKTKTICFLLTLVFPFVIKAQKISPYKQFNSALIKISYINKSEINFDKAQSFYRQKEWDSTLVYTTKQLNYENKKLKDFCHYLRGNSFKEKELYGEAEKEFNQISKQFPFYPLVNYNYGVLSVKNKKFNEAINYYTKATNALIKENKDFQISNIYLNIGVCYIQLNQLKKAEEYILKNTTLLQSNKDTTSLYQAYTNIANLYYKQYKDQQAIPYFEKAYALSKQTKDFEKKRQASLNMAVVEENRNNFKQALIYRKETEQWKDSLNDQNKVWAVAEFEKKYAIAQKQKQISILNIENKLKITQRNYLFYAALGLLVLLIAGIFVYGQKVKNAKIILLQKNKLDALNATKDQLFSIVSHDLRSSVNALKTSNTKLSNSLETKNYEELDQLLLQNSAIANSAYRLLDNLLHWALLQTKQLYFNKESIHLHSIVQQIEYNYKPLLADKAITFENSVSKNSFIFVDLDSIKIVLRNLLDNAIKFTPKNGKISMYTQEAPSGFWQLTLEDNGQGMGQNTIDALLNDSELLAKKRDSEIIGTGLGMQLCKQMIKKNNGTLAIESELQKGTKIIITLAKTKA